MSVFNSITKRYDRLTPKQFILTGVFVLAFAGAIAGGFASKGLSSALSNVRDCGNEGGGVHNSIDYADAHGGCGALSPSELKLDLSDNNPGDLQTIYADSRIGLPTSQYDRFASTAKQGYITKSGGNVVVDGQTVMTGVWTMGRTTLNGSQPTPINIGGKTYYHSPTEASFGPSQLDAMVMFDADGTVEAVVMNSCGNPVTQGNKIKSSATCDKLDKFAVSGKENTYQFSAHATPSGLAKIVKYDFYYNYNDGTGEKLFDTTTVADTKTKEVTFAKSATVSVKVTISLPGGNTKVISNVELCSKNITVVKKELLHTCDELVASSTDNITFRFTVHTKQSDGVIVKSADFTLDGKTTTTDVTKKDAQGNIYRDYSFTDTTEHRVSAVVNFEVDGKKVTSTEKCEARATAKKAPECVEKPGSGFPPGDARCKETPKVESAKTEMPKTGPGDVVSLFAGTTLAGAAGHRLYLRRRNRRSE